MKDEDSILKEMMRLGVFLAQICKIIGHDDTGDGCCARCGAVGSVCKEKEQKMQQMHYEIMKLQRELAELRESMRPYRGTYPGDGSGPYRKSDQWQSADSKIYLGSSPKLGDIK